MPENDHNYDPNIDEHNDDAPKRNADDDVLAFAY